MNKKTIIVRKKLLVRVEVTCRLPTTKVEDWSNEFVLDLLRGEADNSNAEITTEPASEPVYERVEP